MMECRLTIFTPAYNRAYCISNCYQSLKRQSNKNFRWIVVDDGSSDCLDELVAGWIQMETDFSIEYYRKDNGGLYTAYNLALKHVQTEYWMCVDSDDWLTDNAVEIIYREIVKSEGLDVCGLVGLDASPDGNILGGEFPNITIANLIELKLKYRHKGDMKMVYRTCASLPFTPMPEIAGEKDFNPYYMMLQMDEVAPLYIVNEVLCIVDYQPDGMSKRILNSYQASPVSYGMLRLQYLKMEKLPWWFAYKQRIYYVSSWLLARKQGKTLERTRLDVKILAAFLPGALLYCIIRVYNLRK